MMLLNERYENEVLGIIGCFDRVLITGTLPKACYPEGMRNILYEKNVRVFDYPEFAEGFRELVRKNAEELARVNNIEIDHISKNEIRKEDVIKKALEALQKDGKKVDGLFYIISAMESCSAYAPWMDKKKNFAYLRGRKSKCLHYYFYFIDEYLGLCYVRVPTWLPFRLQIYFNGHNFLANRLREENINFQMADNSFLSISDFARAQEISDNFSGEVLHGLLNKFAEIYCPAFKAFAKEYYWSVMQVEYATDIVFRKQRDLQKIYETLVRTAVHTVKPDHIATFLGRKMVSHFKGEAGNRFDVRKEGSTVKHTMGKVSIKMYDKFQIILRIETTSTDISFFQHYRMVEHKDGTSSKEFTSMKKNIYSLGPLIRIAQAVNRRYLEFISAIEDKSAGIERLEKVTRRIEQNNRRYKGLNFFDEADMTLMGIICRGEYNISGFRNKDIRKYLTGNSSGQISRMLKRLKVHGLVKKANNSYKYYLTKLGKQSALTAMKIKALVIIPALNY